MPICEAALDELDAPVPLSPPAKRPVVLEAWEIAAAIRTLL